MEVTVRINTVFGAVNIKGELTFSMSKDFINGVKDATSLEVCGTRRHRGGSQVESDTLGA